MPTFTALAEGASASLPATSARNRRTTTPPSQPPPPALPTPSRRSVLSQTAGVLLGSALMLMGGAGPAQAVGFKKELKPRRGSTAAADAYTADPSGAFSILDMAHGKAGTAPIAPGDTVTVHFDSLFRGIDVASSRSARLLGGNRTIAEPFVFVAGQKVDSVSRAARPTGDSAGGLFSGASGPEPPPALSTAVLGMRVGGKRSVLIPEGSPAGYGSRGLGEIPPNGGFELRVEVLEVVKGGGA